MIAYTYSEFENVVLDSIIDKLLSIPDVSKFELCCKFSNGKWFSSYPNISDFIAHAHPDIFNCIIDHIVFVTNPSMILFLIFDTSSFKEEFIL